MRAGDKQIRASRSIIWRGTSLRTLCRHPAVRSACLVWAVSLCHGHWAPAGADADRAWFQVLDAAVPAIRLIASGERGASAVPARSPSRRHRLRLGLAIRPNARSVPPSVVKVESWSSSPPSSRPEPMTRRAQADIVAEPDRRLLGRASESGGSVRGSACWMALSPSCLKKRALSGIELQILAALERATW